MVWVLHHPIHRDTDLQDLILHSREHLWPVVREWLNPADSEMHSIHNLLASLLTQAIMFSWVRVAMQRIEDMVSIHKIGECQGKWDRVVVQEFLLVQELEWILILAINIKALACNKIILRIPHVPAFIQDRICSILVHSTFQWGAEMAVMAIMATAPKVLIKTVSKNRNSIIIIQTWCKILLLVER